MKFSEYVFVVEMYDLIRSDYLNPQQCTCDRLVYVLLG